MKREPKKIAIVHDWLVTYAGAERVLEQMLNCFPQADLFAVVDGLPADGRRFIKNKPVTTTFIQKLPFAKKKYRSYLPLMPLAIEQLDLSAYDLVISSSHAVAKGVLTGPDQCHISYVYSPMRYAWELQHEYLQTSRLTKGLKSWIVRLLLHRLRQWDLASSNRVDSFLAVSQFIADRVRKCYRREADVINPPVDISQFTLNKNPREDFYLTASRLVPYKKVELIVKTFTAMPEKKLVVIGDGPHLARVKQLAGPNVSVLGFQPFDVMCDHMQRAKAFIYAANEDFGIVPLEAQACGTPVIAFAKGGALETVIGFDSERPTGLFFDEQTPNSLTQAVKHFEQIYQRFDPQVCRDNALKFSNDVFCRRFTTTILETYQHYFHQEKRL